MKKKTDLRRYFKDDKNIYPYAKLSNFLWGIGILDSILLAVVIVAKFLIQFIQYGAVKLQEITGKNSSAGEHYQRIIDFQFDFNPIFLVLGISLLVIAVAYVITIALRHHEGELRPFKDDRLAEKLKREVIKNAEWNIIERDDNGKPTLPQKEMKAREIAKQMSISIHTRKEVNGSDFFSIAQVLVERPKNDTVRNLLEKNYLKTLREKLGNASESFVFSEMQKEKKHYRFDAKVNVTEFYVEKIEAAQERLERWSGHLENVHKKEKKNSTKVKEKILSFDLEILKDEELAKEIEEQQLKAAEETENLKNSLATFVASHDDINIQFEEVKATTSVARFTYSIPAGSKNASPETIQKNLENDLRIKNTIVSNEAGNIIISIPLKNKITADAYSGFKAVLERPTKHNVLDIFIGIDINGQPVVRDLGTSPHILLSGGTGSGKSVVINQIFASLMLENTPDNVKFIFIDPKTTEFQVWKDCPFLYTDIITDMAVASSSLNALWTEMERRNQLMAGRMVRNLASYNAKVSEEEKEPYLVVVVDELSYLMKVFGDQVEKQIEALGEKGRSSGIHVILATQSPRADVVRGKIKANMMTGISLRVKTALESDIALDEHGAEKLNGKGDTLTKWNGDGELVRSQGTFLTDENLAAIINQVKENYPDDKYYERVSMSAFKESFIEPKKLGDVTKGAVYRYALSHNSVEGEEEADAEPTPTVTPTSTRPTIAEPLTYITPKINLEQKEDMIDILETRNKKLMAVAKQRELELQPKQSNSPKPNNLEATSPEEVTPVTPSEPLVTPVTPPERKIIPTPPPKDWNFRSAGYGSKPSISKVSRETNGGAK